MSAYIIVDIDVTDPTRYERYKDIVPASIAAYGGRYLVRGGRAETLEGSWTPKRVVVLEFSSYEKARAWWASSEYAEAKQLRQQTSRANMVVVEGQ